MGRQGRARSARERPEPRGIPARLTQTPRKTSSMPDATAMWKPIEEWAGRHRLLLGAFGHVLAFAVLFGGVALAAYTSDFADTIASALLGAAAIGFVKLYSRSIPAAQRLIDRLHPEPNARAKPDG